MLDRVLAGAVGVAARIGPFLAPLPTAWLVYERTLAAFGWPAWVALAAAAIVEVLGLSVTVTALELRAYNRERPRKTDPAAPMALPLLMIGLYVLAAELLVVVLDVWPAAGRIAPAVFPALSLAAMAVLGVRADHARRVADVDAAVSERKRARAERRQAQAPTPPPSPVADRSFADFARAANGGELDAAAMTGEQVAAWAGVNVKTGQPWSASTGRRWLRRWGNGDHGD